MKKKKLLKRLERLEKEVEAIKATVMPSLPVFASYPFSNPKLQPGPDGVLRPIVSLTGGPIVPIDGFNCACSPIGYPHSQNCKGWFPGHPSYEELSGPRHE